MSRRFGERAIVIGGSMAGLLAARALAEHFEHVTVLERDTFPQSDIPRKGVPQGRHAHGLLARGRNVIEASFPAGPMRSLPAAASAATSSPTSTGSATASRFNRRRATWSGCSPRVRCWRATCGGA